MSAQTHVLMICTDHWPAHLLGAAGHSAVQTPTLDELSRNGVRYTNAYSECPVCIPARRTLMTGTTCRTHGDREFQVLAPMPELPTLAQTFRDNGYQAMAVGKLHVFPQRDRIGFDDVLLAEEGRPLLGAIDDYDLWLGDEGLPGQSFAHGMSNNEYSWRPFHMVERYHVTNWTTQTMCRQIRRRDPKRPGFWYLSYVHPHPPLVPLQAYLDLYRDIPIDEPQSGEWSLDKEQLPYYLKIIRSKWQALSDSEILRVRRAFYASATHIDHQLRLVIGTLREEGLLDDTIILFTSDHGDMLGNHGLWAKRLFYEQSANVPLILLGARGDERISGSSISDRLVGWQDVMPTLLDLAGLEIPETVEGSSMVRAEVRPYLYGECGVGPKSSRMIRKEQWKLIYYPCGNRFQLFNLVADPAELHDISNKPEFATHLKELQELLVHEMYGQDLEWLSNGVLVGCPEPEFAYSENRSLSGQRGTHWPPPPIDHSGTQIGMP